MYVYIYIYISLSLYIYIYIYIYIDIYISTTYIGVYSKGPSRVVASGEVSRALHPSIYIYR